MNYVENIFKRADIQEISRFLLYGVECPEREPTDYNERISLGYQELSSFIEQKYQDSEEVETLMNHILQYTNILEGTYMEIGLQCGFKILNSIPDIRKEE